MVRLCAQRYVHRNKIRARHQRLKVYQLNAQLSGLGRVYIGVIGQYLRFKATQFARHRPRNTAKTDQAQRLALKDSGGQRQIAIPDAAPHRPVLDDHMAHDGKHQRNGVFGHRDGNSVGGIGHYNAAFRGQSHRNIVGAAASADNGTALGNEIKVFLV